jgi:hypothetical protein
VGQAIIRRIQDRTLEGIDSEGKPFAGYSKRYVDSKEFRIAGKSASRVDLRLTHEMMNSLAITESAKGSVTIGFTSTEASKKAEWAEASDNGPSRKFMGISESELSKILAQYAAPESAMRNLAIEALQRIFSFGKTS